jgi:hydrogenase nickel incorporation protein HypA/HybF
MKTMRELQATQSILKKALHIAQERGTIRIKSLHIALGEISELDPASIQQHWNDLRSGTPAEQAQLHFRLINAEVQCMSCFKKYHPENGVIHCHNCGSFGAKILSGEEFYVESIEMDDE